MQDVTAAELQSATCASLGMVFARITSTGEVTDALNAASHVAERRPLSKSLSERPVPSALVGLREPDFSGQAP